MFKRKNIFTVIVSLMLTAALMIGVMISFSACEAENGAAPFDDETSISDENDAFDGDSIGGNNEEEDVFDEENDGVSSDSSVDEEGTDSSTDNENGDDGSSAPSDGDNDTSVNDDDVLPFSITCVSGSENAYSINGRTVTFTSLTQDSVYSISGSIYGNIIIDVGDEYKLDIELCGFTLTSDTVSPIVILSGNEISLSAKKGYENFIYDKRTAVNENDESVYSAAVYSFCDLEICGKGSLSLISENNNGIHSKDDLKLKNLMLYVKCKDNALKGNDSVEIESGATTLIATLGDCIKTSNSDISEKGKQRGTVTISGGTHELFSACDAIDAAYDVIIDGSMTVINIYTDKYSEYSEEVTAVDNDEYYIRFSTSSYKYSVKYYNSDDDFLWVDAEYHSKVSGGRSNYYYYSFPKMNGYASLQIYIYSSDSVTSQGKDYLGYTDYIAPSDVYDTVAFTSRWNSISYSWTNYTTSVSSGGPGGMGGMGGPGGMVAGNTDKGDHSTKGIKAANSIVINNGTLNITSYDDAIHANSTSTLENGEVGSGNVTINGGRIRISSSDDGLHADGTLTVNAGEIDIIKSYEGAEGLYVIINGGNLSIISSDDGINATSSSGAAVSVTGGNVYVYARGDGIDSNSRTSYGAIVFSGGNTVVISTSGGNSAIDSEGGYKYTKGAVTAVMPSNAMVSESKRCSGFSSIASSKNISLSEGNYLTVSQDSKTVLIVKMPTSISASVIYLGSNTASIASVSDISEASLDSNGVYWAD